MRHGHIVLKILTAAGPPEQSSRILASTNNLIDHPIEGVTRGISQLSTMALAIVRGYLDCAVIGFKDTLPQAHGSASMGRHPRKQSVTQDINAWQKIPLGHILCPRCRTSFSSPPHKIWERHKIVCQSWDPKSGEYICVCGRGFRNTRGIGAHKKHCTRGLGSRGLGSGGSFSVPATQPGYGDGNEIQPPASAPPDGSIVVTIGRDRAGLKDGLCPTAAIDFTMEPIFQPSPESGEGTDLGLIPSQANFQDTRLPGGGIRPLALIEQHPSAQTPDSPAKLLDAVLRSLDDIRDCLRAPELTSKEWERVKQDPRVTDIILAVKKSKYQILLRAFFAGRSFALAKEAWDVRNCHRGRITKFLKLEGFTNEQCIYHAVQRALKAYTYETLYPCCRGSSAIYSFLRSTFWSVRYEDFSALHGLLHQEEKYKSIHLLVRAISGLLDDLQATYNDNISAIMLQYGLHRPLCDARLPLRQVIDHSEHLRCAANQNTIVQAAAEREAGDSERMASPCLACGDVFTTRNLDTYTGDEHSKHIRFTAAASRPISRNEGAYPADMPPPLRADEIKFNFVETTPPRPQPETPSNNYFWTVVMDNNTSGE
ncbi:uncharacterized protein GIQ15_01645 [Arthroderma uncinatum]|uniref:uncharacterized protein n=1 Tax=Arthroderma uncinatum TaxID=74035 RepID=UPI00144A7797|nr:uncharacterized protein GIQ15_01645 [Arthroderma uncinatum]KAF3492128.1 hypothetical protein GIQ15_01645 [Arthroderma uncinatum]